LSGVFQIDREIFEHGIWNNVAEFRIFFYILGNAVWKEEGKDYGNVHVGRGQYLRSYRNLREDLMYMDNNAIKYYSLSYIKKITDKLVLDERIEKEETELGTLFTVVNYSLYQGFDRFKDNSRERSENGARTEREQNENGARTEREQNENNKKKDKKAKKDKNIYKDIVEYLNQKCNKNFRYSTKATQRFINARLNEDFTLEDFKKVIDIKSSQWLGGEMEQYLRPQTLFGTKFESYLNEKGDNNGKYKGDNGQDDEYAGIGISFEDLQKL